MKILVLRFSSIGDIVLTTPVLRCLKLQTGATIHFLTRHSFIDIVQYNPHVDKVFVFDKKIAEVTRDLQAEDYDLVIDLHHNFRSWQVGRALGKPIYKFNKLNIRKWLIVNLKIDILPHVHIVNRYMETVAHLGVQLDDHGLDFFIPPHLESDLHALHPALQVGEYIAFVIGATHFTKRLPEHKIVEFCRKTSKPIVLLGGKSEADTGISIATQGGFHVINACGKLSIFESASVIKQAGLVVSHDTGLMHIAAAFGKKIISVWGNTIPEFGMYPFYGKNEDNNTSLQVQGLSCRPCSKIGYKKCPKGHFKCMELINWDQISF